MTPPPSKTKQQLNRKSLQVKVHHPPRKISTSVPKKSSPKKSSKKSPSSRRKQEQKKEQMKREQRKREQRNELHRQKVIQAGYRPVPNKKDGNVTGNCLFEALSMAEYGTATRHRDVRLGVCTVQTEHTDVYPFHDFVEDDQTQEEYIEEMRKDSTWGGQKEILAASLLFGRYVIVYCAEYPDPIQHPSASDGELLQYIDQDKSPINLLRTDESHYELLRGPFTAGDDSSSSSLSGSESSVPPKSSSGSSKHDDDDFGDDDDDTDGDKNGDGSPSEVAKLAKVSENEPLSSRAMKAASKYFFGSSEEVQKVDPPVEEGAPPKIESTSAKKKKKLGTEVSNPVSDVSSSKQGSKQGRRKSTRSRQSNPKYT